MRYRARVLIASTLALGLALTACTKNTGSSGGSSSSAAAGKQSIVIDFKGTTTAPAPAVTGAKSGGNVNWLEDGEFEHLSPPQIYVAQALNVSTQLFFRTLTQYIEPAKSGDTMKVVGDLATNAGETTDGGKTWTYHLRDGIKFEDGTPITSKDIAFTVGESMGPLGANGPQYLHQDLDPAGTWVPGQTPLPPGVTTPDDKTIVFSFKDPHPEMPYLGAMPTTAPIPAAKYDKEKYEDDWVSSGPYKRKSHNKGTQLVLERNPNWDPKTDPIRHAYPDTYTFDFTADIPTETQRIMSDTGNDQFSVMYQNVDQSQIGKIQGDPTMMSRMVTGPAPFEYFMYINTSRVTDVDVRRALNYTFNRDAIIKAFGGSAVADPATTLMPPGLAGYQKYDAYPGGVEGDPDKAKQLLTGKTVPKLSYCYRNTTSGQQYASVVQNAEQRAGFQIALVPIDKAAFYTQVGDKKNTCDLIQGAWGFDFPDNYSVLDTLFNGKNIVDKGNNNLSYFSNPTTDQKLTALRTETDRAKAADEYAALDKEIMTDYAPAVPWFYFKTFTITGSKVGGAFNSTLYGCPNLTNVWAKS